MKKYTLIETDFELEPTEIILAGWDLKDADKTIMQILNENICKDERAIIKKITKREIAYSYAKFEMGTPVEDIFNSISYHKNWKRGYGKCTSFRVEWDLTNKKKTIKIKLSFKSRLEMFLMKIKLFGFRGSFGINFDDVKELFRPKELRCLYG